MGQEESINILSYNQQNNKISRNYFDFLYVIGKGGFGKVTRKHIIKK